MLPREGKQKGGGGEEKIEEGEEDVLLRRAYQSVPAARY